MRYTSLKQYLFSYQNPIYNNHIFENKAKCLGLKPSKTINQIHDQST